MAEPRHAPVSLLDELQAGSGFEAALLGTFNAYLPFVEEVVLRRLRASGCHYVVVLMDRVQLTCEFSDRNRRPSSAGRKYALLPISCRRAFHPKLAIMVGPRTARVIVGSHNLTMSGIIQNREATNVIEIAGPGDRAGSAALIEAVEFCRAWAAGLPSDLRQAIEDFAALCRPYLGPVPKSGETTLVGSRPNGASLWQRVRRLLPEKPTRIMFLSPFFDGDLSFVRRVSEDMHARELLIGIDPETACYPGATKKLPRGSKVVDVHDLDPGHKGRGYLHAKAMLIESSSERILVAGSANPTAAAWLLTGEQSNAEMVVVRRLPRGPDDLGLDRLWKKPAMDARVLSKLRSRPEYPTAGSESSAPLIGVCRGTKIRIEGVFGTVSTVIVRDARGTELASSYRKMPTELVIEVSSRAHEASSIEAVLDGTARRGFVHHVDLLREAAISSSQRRVREALSGLNGDPSQLEELLRLVAKVIFDAPSIETSTAPRGKTSSDSKKDSAEESTVQLVSTLKRSHLEETRRLSTGDLGLLLDYLMRRIWQSLVHEPSSATRSEAELIGSEDEALLAEPPTDREIAEAWHRKSGTLLRRLWRRIEEGADAPRIIVETAAVLGVLEAVRRVEDQDRWRLLRVEAKDRERLLGVEFVDRDQGADFIFDAVPRLLKPTTGLLDVSTKQAGMAFAEQQGVIEWITWLAWLTGFGPGELQIDEDEDESDAAADAADMFARDCLIGARLGHADRDRILELLEASPFPGTDADAWLDSLIRLGRVYGDPGAAAVVKRSPRPSDLVITSSGGRPYVVRSVRGDKVDLVDFERANETATYLASRVRVLASGVEPKRRAVGW